MANVYKLNNMSSNNDVDNNYNNDYDSTIVEDDKRNGHEDIGQNIFNTVTPTDGKLSFFNLGSVHIDYLEMKRECNQIVEKGTQSISDLNNLASAMSELAGLVGYSLNFSGVYENYIQEVKDDFGYIESEMNSQINLYTKQSQLTTNEIIQLNNMVTQIINNPQLQYSDKYGAEHLVDYNDALKSYKKEALMSGYGVVELDYLLENCKTTNKAVDVYSYIENNLQEEMTAVGASSGKEYLSLILDNASKDAKTNREKAVCRALALNKFLGEHGIATRYVRGGGHTTFSIDDVASGSDCSSYASTLAMQGNSEFEAGWTGSLYNSANTTALDINNILPGDIIVSHGNSAYEHARFVIGVDKENNRIITTECGGYYGSGGYDVNNGGFSKSHVDSFDVDTLIRQGYRTNHVNYGDNDTVIVDKPSGGVYLV